jgi:hypothetical protein
MFKKKRLRKIAIAVVDEIGKQYLGTPLLSEPDFVRGIFASVCLRLNFIPTEDDTRLIFEQMKDEIMLRQIDALVG